MPISLSLEQKINNLYPFGEIDIIEDNIKLPKEAKKTIQIIGECIREFISKEDNQIISLITISKIIYAGNYRLSSYDDTKEIQKLTSNTPNEIESCMKLVRHIENKI